MSGTTNFSGNVVVSNELKSNTLNFATGSIGSNNNLVEISTSGDTSDNLLLTINKDIQVTYGTNKTGTISSLFDQISSLTESYSTLQSKITSLESKTQYMNVEST